MQIVCKFSDVKAMFPTTTIILDDRYQKNDGTYSVKLRLTHNRKQVYYPLNITLTKDDWEKTQCSSSRGEFKQYKLIFNKIEQRAVEIIRNLASFSFIGFEAAFIDHGDPKKDLYLYFNNYVKTLSEEGRIGTAESYSNAINSFKKFVADKRRATLPFEMVDVDFLKKYEIWMVAGNGKSLTTVGIYTRSLRTILNLAIEKGDMSKEQYPFGKRKYQIPAGSNVKKALLKQEIKKIVEHSPKSDTEEWARDMWLLSYLSNGANMKDLSLLKIKNLSPTSIQFIRSKTERSTKQDLKPIVVMRIAKINEILQKWGNVKGDQEAYVFEIVNAALTTIEMRLKIKQATKTINKYMRRIGSVLEIEKDLTTYTARHSYATVLKRSGASIDFISESLGHKDTKTTENYLDSFEDETKMAFQNSLLEF